LTPLLWACSAGNVELVRSITRCCLPSSPDTDANTPDANIVRPLDINEEDEQGWTALTIAAFSGHYEIVKYLLTIPDIDVNNDHVRTCCTSIYLST
jgi:hypothetical protein